jgi:hypothetical protein
VGLMVVESTLPLIHASKHIDPIGIEGDIRWAQHGFAFSCNTRQGWSIPMTLNKWRYLKITWTHYHRSVFVSCALRGIWIAVAPSRETVSCIHRFGWQ